MSKSFSSSNWFKTSLLATALPLAAVAVLCADNLLALTSGSGSSPSLILESSKAWQDDAMDETLGAQYVELDGQNRLIGTVTAIEEGSGMTIPVPGLRVKLVQRSNEISSSLTDANGNFSTDALIPGSYTLCISGNEGFLAYGIQVIDTASEAGEEFEMPNLQDAANGNPSNQKQLIRYRLVQDQPTDIKAAVIPPTHNALKEIINQIPADVGLGGSGIGGNAKINVEDSVVAGGFQVSLQDDSTLVGRIAPLTSSQDVPVRLREMSV
ncbi:MAG: carboxypeptidase-like regulatory domain-containing protein, partial [Pirellulaceae bacterium]|nr:carboxypeptidase-like regulatory domain-containing protein [Pirellulaceae bacterium]